MLAAPLASKPGERFEYSNEGYSLAAAIVERVSGTGYEAYLRQHVLLPAGLTDTGYQAPGWPLARLPIGYTPDGRPWGRVYKNGWLPDGPGWYLRGNGGIQSTLADLYRWHLALEAGKVLSADAVKKFQTGHVASMGSERYGYGWGVQTTRRGTKVGDAQRRERVHLQRCQALPRREGGHHRDEQSSRRFQPRSWRRASSSRWCSVMPRS